MTRPFDPYEYASDHNIKVEHSSYLDSNGLWIPDENTILLRHDLSRLESRSSLAHELGHAELGHFGDSPKQEAMADRWAAQKLVPPLKLSRIAATTTDLGAWCRELDITPRILEAYLKDLHERFP